jgi:hypothetical protein
VANSVRTIIAYRDDPRQESQQLHHLLSARVRLLKRLLRGQDNFTSIGYLPRSKSRIRLRTPSICCASPLPPGATCALALDIPEALWPGQYSIALGVAGREGGWSQKGVPVSVRFSYWVAFLATALGAGAGWYVQAWRSGGRCAVKG